MKRSRKLGNWGSYVGLSGFSGLANLSGWTAGSKLRLAAVSASCYFPPPNSAAMRMTPLFTNSLCRPFGDVTRPRGQRSVLQSTHHHRPASVVTAAKRALVAAAIASCLAAAGCSSVQSQQSNVAGVQLYNQGNYQQASDRFQQAIAQNPESPEGYYNLAASLHKTGTLYNRPADLQQAEVLYNQCLERDPSHVECHRGLSVLLTETNRQAESFRLLNNWAASNPKSPEPKIELARALEESGQIEQAKVQLVDALTVDPHNARALTALGRLRDQSGNYAQALSDYQRSLAVNRYQPDVSARVAQLQAATNTAPTTAPAAAAKTASGPQPAVRY
jgi:tetratricopeptide (TPR) repeat protein